MTGVRVLPLELWHKISEPLDFLDIWSLTVSCKTFYTFFSRNVYARRDDLQKHYRVLDQYDGQSRHDGSRSLRQAFDLFLRRELPPFFIETTKCDEIPQASPRGGHDPDSHTTTLASDETLQQAIEASPWIYEHERMELLQLLQCSDEDAILCVLLPLLDNLKYLHIICLGRRVHTIVARIAGSRTQAVLPSLEVVTSSFDENGQGMSLVELAGYAALPSVRGIGFSNFSYDAEGGFPFEGWPSELPRSRASHVTVDGYLSNADTFAEGFRGPCNITLNCNDTSIYLHDPGHCHLIITAGVDPSTEGAISGTRIVRYYEDDGLTDLRCRDVATVCDLLV